MSHGIDISNPLLFEGLFNVWKQRGYDLYFYFQEIFDKAVVAIEAKLETSLIKVKKDGEPIYKAMFLPVGFTIENVALVTALFKPVYVKLAFSETTKEFHRRHIHIVEKKIKECCPSINIDRTTVSSDDHQHIEKKIMEWAEEIKDSYGVSGDQLAIDLTGGTKPMSIGAQNAAKSLGISAFYLSAMYDKDTQLPIPGTETLLKMPNKQTQSEKKLVFVIMPFSDDFNQVYAAIEDAVVKEQLRCIRVDKEIFLGGIMDRIRENIAKSGTVIADLSIPNPNVYYELGLAHAWNKKTVMITQNLDKVPFDLKHLRLVIYDPLNIDEFKKKLKKELTMFGNN